MSSILESDIKFLPGVGPKRAELLNKELNIKTFRDFLLFFPFRYIDRTKIYSVSEIESSMSYIQLRGRITRINVIGEKGPAKRLVATFADATGVIDLVFFQGIKWIKDWLKINTEYIIFGKPSLFNQTINIVHPEIEPATEENPIYVGNMLGVYPSTERLRNNGFSNKQIARLMATLIKTCQGSLNETLPSYILDDKRLMPFYEAIQNIHFPKDLKTLAQAQFRFKFEELFYLQLSLLKQKSYRERALNGIVMNKVGEYFDKKELSRRSGQT